MGRVVLGGQRLQDAGAPQVVEVGADGHVALKPVGRRVLPLVAGGEAEHQLGGEGAAHLDPVAAGRPVEPEVEAVPLTLVIRQLDLRSQCRQQLDGERVGVAAHGLRVELPEVADRQQARAGLAFDGEAAGCVTFDGVRPALTLHAVGTVVLVRHPHRRAGRRRSGCAAGHVRHSDRLPREPQLQRAHAQQRRLLVLGTVEVGICLAEVGQMAQIAVHGRAGQRTDDHQALRERQERLGGMELHQHRGTQVRDAVRIRDPQLGADRQPARPRFLDAHLLDRPGGQRHAAAQRAVQAAAAADGRPFPVPEHLDPLEEVAALPHRHPHVAVARGYRAAPPGSRSGRWRSREPWRPRRRA